MGLWGKLFGRTGGGGASEIDLAERATRERDFSHAAHHLGQALIDAPLDERANALVELLAESTADACETYARLDAADQPVAAGRVALRAALLARGGGFDGAFSLLVQLVAAVPDAGLEVWLARWTRDPRFARTDPAVLLASLHTALADLDPASVAYPKIMTLVHGAGDVHRDDDDLAFFRVVFARRVDPVGSVALAEEIHRARPTWRSATALHGSRRAVRDGEGALAAIEEAMRLAPAPEELTIRLDLADTLLDLGRHAQALAEYERVLAEVPGHPWALPSACFVRALAGDEVADKELRALARSGNDRARSLARDLPGLKAPGAATTDVADNLCGQLAADPPPAQDEPYNVTVTVTCLEPPSSRLSAQAELDRHGRFDLQVAVTRVPVPDPRKPIGEVDLVPWRYEDTQPIAALPEPPASLRSQIEAIARSRYSPDAWWDAAGELLEKRSAPPTPVELVSVMVHPGAAPPDVRAWDWWYRVQVAAALVIAQLDDDVAETTLFSIARGPLDWTSCAAVIAIGECMLNRIIPIDQALGLFDELKDNQPDEGDWCLGVALTQVFDRLEEKSREQQGGLELLARLEVGETLEGTIKCITEYGAFVDLGGIDGLLHRVDVSEPPPDIDDPTHGGLVAGQTITVEVIRLDRAAKRIGLRLRTDRVPS